MQWSRRFIGLKVLLSLMVAGWDGYSSTIRHQTAMGDALRARLVGEGWKIRNEAKLPVVCFTRDRLRRETAADCARVVNSGEAWIDDLCCGEGDGPAGVHHELPHRGGAFE